MLRCVYLEKGADAQEMAAMIKADPQGVGKAWAVVDVRDSDFAVSRVGRAGERGWRAPARR